MGTKASNYFKEVKCDEEFNCAFKSLNPGPGPKFIAHGAYDGKLSGGVYAYKHGNNITIAIPTYNFERFTSISDILMSLPKEFLEVDLEITEHWPATTW